MGKLTLEKQFVGICSKVIDGDTVVVRGQKIRLVGLDAPELKQKSLEGIAIGKFSQRYLAKKILGKKVHVYYQEQDKYQRILGRIILNGEDINRDLLFSGYAVTYWNQNLDYQKVSFQAKLQAKGIWAFKGFVMPSYYRKWYKKRGQK